MLRPILPISALVLGLLLATPAAANPIAEVICEHLHLLPERDPHDRLPGSVHVTIPGVDGESLVLLLDRAGVSASMGSACRAGVAETSHVLLAMGLDARTARGALRLTLGRGTTEADLDAAVEAIAAAVPVARVAFSA